jgi:hypothetical protein
VTAKLEATRLGLLARPTLGARREQTPAPKRTRRAPPKALRTVDTIDDFFSLAALKSGGR